MITLAKKYNVNIEGLKFKRRKMFLGNATFCVLTPNTIWLNKKGNDWDMIDEVAHEVIHRKQFKRYGLATYLLSKTFCRLFGWAMGGNWIEKEAYAEQTRVDTLKRGL